MACKKRVAFCEDEQIKQLHESRGRTRSRGRLQRSKSQDVGSSREKNTGNLVKKRDHSLIHQIRNGSRKSVQHLVKMFELRVMNEGRKSQIVLPDSRKLELLIQPKLYASELLDLVSSHFNLKEKEYFGIAFIDDTGHNNWLQLEKKVLEHEFSRKTGQLVLYFMIKFYVESISQLRDSSTVELFYLNAKQGVAKGQIECDSETTFELASYVLQATNGDFTSDQKTQSDLKKLPVIPTRTLEEHPSITYCENKITDYYRNLTGTSRGLAVVNYMTILESVPTYGIHYYEVKDKKGIPWWLGLSYKGIAVYDKVEKTNPRKLFTWKHLENLYYRDRKFSIEVHDPKRVSVSRRTFGPGSVNVHAWFASTPQLTKSIWCMAVAQHQFYLDRKHSKTQIPSVRSMSEIAAELCQSSTSLASSLASDLSRSESSHSLPSIGSKTDLSADATREAQREMYAALKARKEALEEAVRKKTEELKRLCIKEGELTGELPSDFPLAPGEAPPQIRRRVGTEYSLSMRNLPTGNESSDLLSQIELECELQGKIVAAALKLAHDKSVSKYVRKQRRQSYQKSLHKLKDIQKKLLDIRKQAGMTPRLPNKFMPDLVEENVTDSESEMISPANSPQVHRVQTDYGKRDVQAPPNPQRIPSGEVIVPPTTVPVTHAPTAQMPGNHNSGSSSGYIPSNVYQTGTTYRSERYPTLSGRSQSTSSNQSEYDNMKTPTRFEFDKMGPDNSRDNSVPVHSYYDSADNVRTPTNPKNYDPYDNVFDSQARIPSKHGSLDRSARLSANQIPKYGSLERNVERVYTDKRFDSANNQRASPTFNYANSRDWNNYYDSPSQLDPPTPRNSNYSHSSDNEPVTPQNSSIETKSYENTSAQPLWDNTIRTEPSPIIQRYREPSVEQCYSPRSCESPYSTLEKTSGREPSPIIHRQSPQPEQTNMVNVRLQQSHMEVTKPYETSDFYKYSEKLRRQRKLDHYQKEMLGQSRVALTVSVNPNVLPYSPNQGQYIHSPSSPYGSSDSGRSGSAYSSPSPYPAGQSPQSHYGGGGYQNLNTSPAPYPGSPYKSHGTGSSQHSHYQPPMPMACQAVSESPSNSPRSAAGTSSISTSSSVELRRSRDTDSLQSHDSSLLLGHGESLAQAFSEEMLAWYKEKDRAGKNPATFV